MRKVNALITLALVCCGLLDTIAIFVPKSLFNIELLPTFGLPTIAIKADLSLSTGKGAACRPLPVSFLKKF